jgi:translocation and assembly module TamB
VTRVWRRLALWLGLPALLAALLLAAAWQALHAPQGVRWAVDWIAGQVPGELSAEQAAGPLVGPWRLGGVRYADATGLEVTLQEITLDWRPLALLTGRIRFASIVGRELALRLPADGGAGGAPPVPPPLPLGLRIDDLTLTGITLAGSAGEAQRIETLTLAGSLSGGGVRLERLRLVASAGELELDGRIDPWRGYRFDLTGQARGSWPGQPEAGGRFTVAGDLDRLRATLDLDRPLAAQAELTVTAPLTQPAWQGRLQVAGADPSRLQPELPPWPTDLVFDGGGTLDRVAGTLALRLHHPDLGLVTAAGELDGDRARLDFSQVTLAVGDPEMRLRLDAATVTLGADPPRFSARGSWQAARWPLTGPAVATSPRGRFDLAGSAEDYRLELDGRVEAAELPAVEVALAGQGDRRALALETWSVTLDDGGGRLAGRGTLGWDPDLRVALQGRAEAVDPGRFAADWPGSLDGPFELTARLADGEPHWQVDLAALSGTLRGQPVAAKGRLAGRGQALTLDGVTARAGTLDATLDGRLGERLDLRWTLASEALDGLLGLVPGLTGRIDASGTLAGPRATPAVSVEATAGALAYGDHAASQVTLRARAAAGLEGALELALTATDLQIAGRAVTRLELAADGSMPRHRLRLDAASGGATVELVLAGGLAERRWGGTLERGLLESGAWGRLRLAAPVTLRAATDAAGIADHCWSWEHAGKVVADAFCGGGQWQADGPWEAALRLADLPLGLLDPLLPEGMTVTGEVVGEAAFRGQANGAIAGRGELRLGPGHVDPGGLIAGAAPLAYSGGRMQLVADDDGTQGTFAVELGGSDRLAGRIGLPGMVPGRALAADLALEGQVDFVLARLDLLATLLPTLSLGPGRVDGRIEIGGTLGAPRLDGRAALAIETVEVPQYGLTLEALELTARGGQSDRLLLQGAVRSGDGTLRFDGEVGPDPETGWVLDLAVRGERYTAVDLRELQLQVTPDLRVKLRGRDLAVSGTVEVPTALIKPRVGGSELQGVSEDTVLVGAEAQAETAPLRLDARVRLALGDQVRFEGFGLRGRIAGAVDITQRPGGVPLGSGALRLVDGHFSRYGQELKIESGRLQFANSPLDDPMLEARAQRVVGEVTAGLQLHGTLRHPETVLFSDPPMSQADTLSYLIVGAPAGQTGGGGSEVMAAAAALGYLADSTVMRDLRGKFGIDDVRFESDSSGEEVALVLGRYLSPELYVGYAVGLATATNTFIARYRLTERLSVEASSGTGDSGAFSGADLNYIIER